MKAIEIPFRDEEHITFGPGADGFPAFVLSLGHDIKIPHKLLLPDRLYANFSILATVKPDNVEGILLRERINTKLPGILIDYILYSYNKPFLLG